MLQVLHPTYTLRVEVQDRPDPQALNQLPSGVPHQFFDSSSGVTGCDQVLMAVRDALKKAGIRHATVSLDRFEHR